MNAASPTATSATTMVWGTLLQISPNGRPLRAALTPMKTPITIPAPNSPPMVHQNRRRRRASNISPSPRSAMIAPIIENLLDWLREQPRQPECERERRVMLARLDRVDRLPRHAEPAAKLSLAPAAFGAQYSQPVLQLASPAPDSESQVVLTICQ